MVGRRQTTQVLGPSSFVPADQPAIRFLYQAHTNKSISSPKTLHTYVYSLYDVYTKCCQPQNKGLLAMLASENMALRDCMLSKYQSVATYVNRLNGILALYNHTPSRTVKGGPIVQAFWRAEQKDAVTALKAQQMDNRVTDKLRNNTLYLKDIEKAIAKVDGIPQPRWSSATPETWVQQMLWLKLALHMPPKRKDLGNVRIVSDTKRVQAMENAISVPTDGPVTLVLNHYKTAKRYGRWEEVLTPEAAAAVRESLRALPRPYLFVMATNTQTPMGDDYFGAWLERAFRAHLGKHATANALRRAWVRERADPTKYTLAERDKLAKSMNHNLVTQIMHYALVDR